MTHLNLLKSVYVLVILVIIPSDTQFLSFYRGQKFIKGSIFFAKNKLFGLCVNAGFHGNPKRIRGYAVAYLRLLNLVPK